MLESPTTYKILAVLAYFLVTWLQPKPKVESKLDLPQKVGLLIAAFVGGIFAGRIPFLLIPELPLIEPGIGANTITMGLFGSYVAVEIAKYFLGVKFKTGDRFALPLAALIVFGRIGCFQTGCCCGAPTELPWAIAFNGETFTRHPTQIYEMIFHSIMFGIVLWLVINEKLATHRLQVYLLCYCIYRFLTEFIRPEPTVLFGMTYYQIVVLLFGAFLAIQWAIETRNERSQGLQVST